MLPEGSVAVSTPTVVPVGAFAVIARLVIVIGINLSRLSAGWKSKPVWVTRSKRISGIAISYIIATTLSISHSAMTLL